MNVKILLPLIFSITLFSCNDQKPLPVFGNKIAVANTEAGEETVDSIDYTIPDFSFVNQDNAVVNTATIENKIFVAEFFFTSCPSICPKMQAQMLRVYEKYKSNTDLLILAYSIDPARDTVAKLNAYAKKLGLETNKWHLLTGNKDSIYSIAEKYLVSASEDPDALGGHVHSGNFILVDKQRRIRGYYDGTDEKSVTKLLDEIDILRQEEDENEILHFLPRK